MTNEEIGEQLGCSEASIRRSFRAIGFVYDEPSAAMSAAALRRRRRDRSELLTPAFEGSDLSFTHPELGTREELAGEGRLIVLLSDEHEPYADRHMHEAVCKFLTDVQPHELGELGDICDFPTPSRHKARDPRYLATPQECINAAFRNLADKAAACPAETAKWFIPGNHDVRINDFALNQAAVLYNISRAETDERILSLRHLLRLDELGFEMVGSEERYPHNRRTITPDLVAHHGDVARKGSGMSALGSIQGKTFGEAFGHTHRQGKVERTIWTPGGDRIIQVGIEIGCGCEVTPEGLGYASHPDWQQGGVTIEVRPDNTWHVDFIRYRDRRLSWRGHRWSV